MADKKLTDEIVAIHTDVYYEELACQEELYLEEMEEEVRAILVSYDPSRRRTDRSVVVEICREQEIDSEVKKSMTDSLDEQLSEAAEELISGDSDDPPVREETVR